MLIAPWPATAPPSSITVSPGDDEADEGAGLGEGEEADQEVGPGAERVRDVLEQLLRGRRWRDERLIR